MNSLGNFDKVELIRKCLSSAVVEKDGCVFYGRALESLTSGIDLRNDIEKSPTKFNDQELNEVFIKALSIELDIRRALFLEEVKDIENESTKYFLNNDDIKKCVKKNLDTASLSYNDCSFKITTDEDGYYAITSVDTIVWLVAKPVCLDTIPEVQSQLKEVLEIWWHKSKQGDVFLSERDYGAIKQYLDCNDKYFMSFLAEKCAESSDLTSVPCQQRGECLSLHLKHATDLSACTKYTLHDDSMYMESYYG